MDRPSPTLVLTGITRRYGETVALDGVDLCLRPGSVHAVLGENGAGKTTLMRVAAGLIRPDAGRIVAAGQQLPAGSPIAAARSGIAMVHQHFMLVSRLTVAENFLIGRPEWGRIVSRRRIEARIAELSRASGLAVDPAARVEALSVGERQRVEILRALSRASRVLILDEPTAVLAPQETDQLFAAVDRLRSRGLAVAFISHKLDEVARICDEVTILRRGRQVHHGPAAGLGTDRMAELMVGSSAAAVHVVNASAGSARAHGGAALELEGLSAADPESSRRIHQVSLRVAPGEILGVAGVEGNGQELLAAAIVGIRPPSGGCIRLSGRDVSREGVRERHRAGLAHVPEDRLAQALVPALSLRENLLLKDFAVDPFARRGLIRWKRVDEYAARRLEQFGVRAPSILAEARQLSGGNQQKVVLARELSGPPRVIVAHNPVRGLDVAATRFVFEQLLAERAGGTAILLIHSDLDELLALSDRIMVMHRGRCLGTDWPRTDRAAIGRMMLSGEPAPVSPRLAEAGGQRGG